jgi:ABC-2 type transport system permease protein
LGIQNTLAFRVNFFVRALFNLLPLTATICLWEAIYEGKTDSVGGYSLAQIVSYYLLATIVDSLTSVTEDDWQIAAAIKDGQISQFLVRPIDHLSYRLCLFASGRLIYTLAALGPVLVFIIWHRTSFTAPPTLTAAAAFVLSLAFSALLQFLLSYLTALLAFWVLEISTFVFILLALQRLASGQMFPLDILPPALQKWVFLSPFPCQIYLPVRIYLGQVTGTALLASLALQAGWVLICLVAARWVWERALKSYAAVGG